MGEFQVLAAARYVSLATFRRDGREVRTPVWIAADGDRLFVFSAGEAGKVKRIRATRRVRLAPCDVRGGLRPDARFVEGRGRIVPTDERETQRRGYAALRRKYGWQMALGDWLSWLSGRYDQRALLEIALESEATAGAAS